MNVAYWVKTLDELTHPDGWIGCRDRQAECASIVLAAMDMDTGWLGHRYEAKSDKDKNSKPFAARVAQSRRNVMLWLAMAHELLERQNRLGDVRQVLGELVVDVAAAALTTSLRRITMVVPPMVVKAPGHGATSARTRL